MAGGVWWAVMSKPFVHLHFHSCYSMLDSACHVEQATEQAAALKMPSLAITDHGVMYGAIDFYKSARAAGVKPIIGCETYVAKESHKERRSEAHGNPHHHLILLATDYRGYQNLSRLVSIAHLDGFYYKPRIDKALLAQHHQGLIGLSACLKGEVGTHLQDGNVAAAAQAAGEYIDILGKDNFFLEFMDHGLPEQRAANRHLAALAKRTGLRVVATNDTHYLKKEHAEAHDVLLCLQTQTVMSDPKRMRYRSNEFYMKTREEMEALASEFEGAVDLTVEIAERCNVEIEFNKPHFPVFPCENGIDQKSHLTNLGHQGIRYRYGIDDPEHPKDERERMILKRFHDELTIIEKTGFLNYFLVVWDFVRFAHEQRIPVGPGRGSGGGSLVAYVLGITALDPIRYDLIFERFLNLDRISPPDFDIDFCQMRRGEVIEYVKQKYGRSNVAQIITFGSLGPKTVIRDVGRVLEIPYKTCDELSKMVPDDPKIDLRKALEANPEFKRAYQSNPDCKRILDYGFVLEGVFRNVGTHAAGVVIGEKPLIEIVPLARDKEGEIITQYSMEPLGEIGLLKMDFLGLKTLTVIQEAVDLIKATSGLEIDLDKLPLDDKPTYALLNRGDTVGVFQLESTGMRDYIRRIGIDRIEDLIAMIALYRPGPMEMLPDYVDRKTGKAKIKYDHPLLEPILKETYGVMVYQEQVQRVANSLAGYSLGEADILRRAMGKKKPEVMEKQRARFVDGCAKVNKIAAPLAQRLFEYVEKFAGYGFNKSHSAGYAIISYQTAYLKANHPAEFMAALLSSEIGNFDKIPVFIVETEEMGLKVLPPDLNASSARFSPDGQAVRYGLAGIKNVGEGAAAAAVAERTRGGPYRGLMDFCSRVDGQTVNRKVLESLIRCGAFDSVGQHRARLFNGIEFAMSRSAAAARDRRQGQGSLFGLFGGEQSAEDTALPECAPWHESELLSAERELLGRYMSGHPLSQYTWLLERYQLTTVQRLGELHDKALTRLGGIATQINKRVTKTNLNMAIVTIEDLDGSLEVLVFPETYARYSGVLVPDAAIMVCGEVSRRDDQLKILAHEIYPLKEVPSHFTHRISLHLPTTSTNDARLERIRTILSAHPGTTPVHLCMQFPAGEKVFIETGRKFGVLVEESLVRKLDQELGENATYISVNKTPCKRPISEGRRGAPER